MRGLIAAGCLLAGLAALWWAVDLSSVARWAETQQRAFQTQIAGTLRALRSGEPGATAALLLAAGAYGFVHALGPGHGKYLIGGVGMGTSVPLGRLLGIAAASSLAQALWAILLVYGGFVLIEASARNMTALAEDILAPLSYLAIATVGAVLAWRGLRAVQRQAHLARFPSADHHAADCGCHAHGPTPGQVAQVATPREALALITSIAIRPCTGAIFLLVIAWQMGIAWTGAWAVIVMGLGTAALTGLCAVTSIAARGATWATTRGATATAVIFPAVQALAGIALVWISLALLGLRLF